MADQVITIHLNRLLQKKWPYFLIFLVLALLFYGTNYRGNWSFWADQELTLAYNGLLINSGLPQEYLDHPGFFSIHTVSILLKASNWLGFNDISDIEAFNSQPIIFEAMNYLVVVARHLSLIFSLILMGVAFYLSKRITKKISLGLLVACLIFFSNGVFYHFTLARTESFAYLFLVSSTYFFLQSFIKEKALSVSNLTISLILLFCAALNKAQILLFVPFYFASTYYFIDTDKEIKAISENENFTLKFSAFAVLVLNGYFYKTQSGGLSLIFNILLLFFFSAYCYAASKRAGFLPFKSIVIFNIIYFLTYQALNIFSRSANYGENLFSNISDPFSMTRFIDTQSGPAGFIARISSNLSLNEKIHDLAIFFSNPVIQLFNKITSPTIFLIFSLGYLWHYRKSVPKKLIIYSAYCFCSYYIVALINSIRYENAYHYVFFQEFFLMGFALLLIYRLPKVRTQVITLSTLIFLILLVNLVPYTHYYNWLKRKGHHPFCTSGLIDYHRRMNIEKIRIECITSKAEN